MKKLFRNSLVALLLVGLIAGCQAKVDSQETTENTQIIASEESNTSTSNANASKTSKVKLKESTTKENKTSNEVKETSSKVKGTSSEVK